MFYVSYAWVSVHFETNFPLGTVKLKLESESSEQ